MASGSGRTITPTRRACRFSQRWRSWRRKRWSHLRPQIPGNRDKTGETLSKANLQNSPPISSQLTIAEQTWTRLSQVGSAKQLAERGGSGLFGAPLQRCEGAVLHQTVDAVFLVPHSQTTIMFAEARWLYPTRFALLDSRYYGSGLAGLGAWTAKSDGLLCQPAAARTGFSPGTPAGGPSSQASATRCTSVLHSTPGSV